MVFFFAALVGLAAGLLVAVMATPRLVEYVDTKVVNAGPRAVFDATRSQADLMRWSAWPSTTGSDCAVANTDGEVGAQTVFYDKKGRQFGFQEVTRLEQDRLVEFKLESKGPPHKPVLRIYFLPIGDEQTEVVLHFMNDISPPFHLLLRLFGVVRWTREMHRKDLDGLKRYCEPPYETYTGEPA